MGTITKILAVALLGIASAQAQNAAFQSWAQRSLTPITSTELDAPSADLKSLKKIVGDKRIVMLSESQHFATEPLAVRNRIFKYLVEELGFSALVIESGLTESRVVHDYVLGGPGDLDTVVSQGFGWTFDLLPQNKELVRWMREYNANPKHFRKIELFGFDVPGSPSNISAKRSADTALNETLRYLEQVDAAEAEAIKARLAPILPGTRWTARDYLTFSASSRDALTAVVSDVVALVERRERSYIAKSSASEYAWAHQNAIGARQIDEWMRRMPVGAKERDYRTWNAEQLVMRNRSMADNAYWVMDRLGKDTRVLFFAALGHNATAPYEIDGEAYVPFGIYMKDRYGKQIVTIGHMAVDGRIGGCGMTLDAKPMPSTSSTAKFADLNVPMYLLDLRNAPAGATWLRETSEVWNGFSTTSMTISNAFDVLFFTRTLTPACAGSNK